MDTPGKRTLAIVAGIAVIAVAAVAFYLLSDDPSLNQLDAAASGFEGADDTFTFSTDTPATRTHDFNVDPGIAAMTIFGSLDLPEDGRWRLLDTEGDQIAQVGRKEGGQQAPLASLVVHRPDPGTWQMVVECDGACEYTLAVYLDDVLTAPTESLTGDVATHEVVLTADHDRRVTREETFEVPENTQSLEFEVSYYASNGGSYRIHDPTGEVVQSSGWGAEWLLRGVSYVVEEQPQPGTWTLSYSCTAVCQGAWGFSFVTPPSQPS